MDFSSLEALLARLNTRVVERKGQLQACCDSIHLLLKPWPAKVREKHKEMNLEENQSEKPKQEAEPEVTPGELEAASLVDKLLTKAQRARNVHRKVNNVGKHNRPENPGEAKTEEEIDAHDKTPAPLEPGDQLSLGHFSPATSAGGRKKDSHAERPANTTADFGRKKKLPPIPHQSSVSNPRLPADNKRNARSQPPSQTNSARSASSRSASGARASGGSQSTAVKPGSAVGSQSTAVKPGSAVGSQSTAQASSASARRPPSAAVRQGSRPAHMSAPFKTDPNVRMPSRQKNLPAKSMRGRSGSQPGVFHGRKKSVIKSESSAGRNQRSRDEMGEGPVDFPPVVILGDGTVLDGTEVSASPSQVDERDSDEVSQKDSKNKEVCHTGDSSTVDQDISENCSARRDEGIKQVTKNSNAVPHTSLPDKPVTATAPEQPAEEPSPKPFQLQKDGRTLPIPIKLRRLYASNCQLRAKLHSAVMTKKVGETDMGKAFASRLEDQMEGEAGLLRQHGFLHCLREHASLLELMDSLQLPALSDESSPEDVYRAKVLVEYVLMRFNELQDEADQYIKGKPMPALGDDLPQPESEECGDYDQWFKLISRGKDPGTLSYRSCQQLQRWSQLQFQQQQLLFHCSLAELALGLLPLLHSLGPQSREYIQVFRAIFSLLTSQGQHLPALVAANNL